jgi:multidrug efflux pump subunit AcrA (membrane-fusion protein)
MKHIALIPIIFILVLCSPKKESTKVREASITESVYSSGIIKSKNQYQVFPHVNGIIESVLVKSGDIVEKGQPIILLYNEGQKVNKQNALLNKQFSDIKNNQGKINDAKNTCENAQNKLINDSILYYKQVSLWKENIGTKQELDQKELNYKNSKSQFMSAQLKYFDLKRQLEFQSEQSRKNLLLSNILEQDYVIRSEIQGKIYSISKEKGEMVSIQSPIAVIGDNDEFLLEMQVDEVDITKIKINQLIIVSFESYKNKVFEAKISKIEPIMNEKTKSFQVEGVFVKKPEKIYPNNNFEANIIVNTKEKALVIPRSYTINDEYIINSKGEKVKIETGIKDYEKIEIISGVSVNDEIIKPSL